MNKIKLLFNKIFKRQSKKPQPKISLLIPVSSSNSSVRNRSLKWLLKYWSHELPDAEVIVGYSTTKVFCKGKALNDAAAKATGKILVIIDADAYIQGSIINQCADIILENMHNHLWYVPYRHLYRLTRAITESILQSSPADPLRLPTRPPQEYIENIGHSSQYGHRYGAMLMMFPREALTTIGGFDERFKGWGGEDVALLRALDTLYGKHKTSNNSILHLWHPIIGDTYKTRMWKGQETPSPNMPLANQYHRATRQPTKMRQLVNEGNKFTNNNKKRWYKFW